jgi:S-adenosylmethionine hydrolase
MNMPTAPKILGLLTDFGLRDHYVGVIKAVALTIAPDARQVDITHDIAPQDIEAGAWTLAAAWRYFPVGSALLAVVDPGVGSVRRAIAFEAERRYFVGPDNGIFTYILAQTSVNRAVELTNRAYHLPAASSTFHGRDIFTPCAAHLLAGVDLAALGEPVDSDDLTRIPIGITPFWENSALVGRVAHVDYYGNLITNIPLSAGALLAPGVRIEIGDHTITHRATHFAAGPADQPFALRDSSGTLSIAIRNGSAAAALGLARGALAQVWGVPYPEKVGQG